MLKLLEDLILLLCNQIMKIEKSIMSHNILSYQIEKAAIRNQIDLFNVKTKRSTRQMSHSEKLKHKSFIKNQFSNKLKKRLLMTFTILSCEMKIKFKKCSKIK